MGTRTQQLVEKARAFGVTILNAHQQEVSNCFANPNTDLGDRFAGRDFFTLETGSPFLAGGLAFFDCQVVDTYLAGTHKVFIGKVVAVKSGEGEDAEKQPLIYFNRGYRELKDSL